MVDMRAALAAVGVSPSVADKWADPVAAACAMHDITAPLRMSAFLAQCSHESARFKRLEEDLRYRNPQRLNGMFSAVRGISDAQDLISRGPAAIANRVYAGRLGNGPEASGDGGRFIGRGLLQITGRTNYREAGKAVGIDLEARPESLALPDVAALVSAWWWTAHGCNVLADRKDFAGITRVVNGPAMAGAEERAALYRSALDVLMKE